MIVKIQLSLDSNLKGHTAGSRMLAYNEDRSVMMEMNTPKEVVNLMDGRFKAFFHADIVDGKLEVQSEAPRQNW